MAQEAFSGSEPGLSRPVKTPLAPSFFRVSIFPSTAYRRGSGRYRRFSPIRMSSPPFERP